MEQNPDRYSDIIDLPHPVSKKRKRMSALDRAAQFSPFAALVGYDAAIREEARLTSGRAELAEDEKAALDRKYRLLAGELDRKPHVRVVWFRPDCRKEGGAYMSTEGRLLSLDVQEQMLILETRERIPFSDVLKLESDLFPGEE